MNYKSTMRPALSLPRVTLSFGVLISSILGLFCFRLIVDLPFPGMEIIEVLLLLVGLVFALFRLMHSFSMQGKKLSAFELYVIILMFIVPLYSAWRAYEVFGQPLIYGVLTQRSLWAMGLILVFLSLMRKGTIQIKHVQKSLLILALLYLILYSFFEIFFDPSVFSDAYPQFATGGDSYGYVYKFEVILLVFASFFYLVRGMLQQKNSDYFKAVPFLFFLIVIHDKRSLTLAMVLAMILVGLFFFEKKRIIQLGIKAFGIIFLTSLIIVVAFPDTVAEYAERYNQAFAVVASGEKGEDASANARIGETLLALPYIEKYWLLGSGDLSNQWNGGYERAMGYFYPSDIGIIGSLFVYGAVGLGLFYTQYLFLLKRQPYNLAGDDKVLWISCYGVLFVLLFQSMIKGGLIFYPSVSLFFITILLGLKKQSYFR